MFSLAFAGTRGAAARAAAVEEGGANGHNSTPDPAAAGAEAEEAALGTGQDRAASSSVQGSAGTAPAPAAATSGEEAPYRAALWAKQTLPGHDLTANASWNAASLDSSASYCQVPLTLALDLSSKDRPDGIQYRVGLHQVRWLLRMAVHWPEGFWEGWPGFVVACVKTRGCAIVAVWATVGGSGPRVGSLMLTHGQCWGRTGPDR